METFEGCKLCGSTSLITIRRYRVDSQLSPVWHDVIKNLHLHQPIAIRLVACQRCGFLFYQDILAFNEMEQLYKAEARYALPKSHQLKTGRLWELERMVAFLSIKLPIDRIESVLDVGAGDFVALDRVIALHPKATYHALDPSYPDRTHNNITVFRTMVEQWKSRNQYDLVTLIHVLEHIGHLSTFMERVSKFVKKEKYLYVEIPFQVGPGLFINRSVSTQHVNYFTPQTIKALLESHEFTVLTLEFDTSAYAHNGMAGMIRVLAKKSAATPLRPEGFLKTLGYLFNPSFILRSWLVESK